MKIVVTGASGFIGRHVIPVLLERGQVVIATGRDRNRAAKFDWFGKVRFIEADLFGEMADPYEYFDKPDQLIHLAWNRLPGYSEAYHFERNLCHDYRFLKRFIESGLRNLVVTGTCMEYGIREGILGETMETAPVNPYALAKDTLRRFLFELQRRFSFNLTWVRLFYTYGPGQNKRSLFSQLTSAIDRGDDSFKMSPGEQLRDYLPVQSVAGQLVQLALLRKNCGIINCCSGQPVSVRSLVERWVSERGARMELDLGAYPYSDHEAMAFWGDRKKLDQLLESEEPD